MIFTPELVGTGPGLLIARSSQVWAIGTAVWRQSATSAFSCSVAAVSLAARSRHAVRQVTWQNTSEPRSVVRAFSQISDERARYSSSSPGSIALVWL